MSLEGKQIGEFEIIERLGQGGMGAVYKARQTSLDRIVALKTLQASLADNADYIARFRQEARAAAGLNHPNLVQVISAGESEGLHWFAMEYVDGESAKVRLKREGRLKPLAAIAIATHVATALEYGWRKAALIHRDIKPDNIFLSGDGEVKLGDLGLAKSAGQAPSLTTNGAWMGTPHYMSPEQAQAMKDVDLRADIYSLGCTLYHLLCGQPPYAGNSSAAVLMKHMSAPAPDLRRAWPECPLALAAVVGKMMRKRPSDRQQTYGEVNADLRRAYAVLHGRSAPAVIPATQMPVARETKRRVPVLAWLAGGVALLAAIPALVYFAPWKKGSTLGTPKPAVSQIAVGKAGRQKMDEGASLAQAATPASRRTAAVAPAPPPAVTPVPTTPAPTSTTPVPSQPIPSTPKPATEVEKWFAQVDGPQQEAFQKQVLKPFEAGVADLRARYLASLDAGMAKASAAGQLAGALAWRAERRAFENGRNAASDDDATPIGVKTLRAAFRQQLAKLDHDRIAQANALHAQYDAILAKNQTLLTKNQHLDDALLIQTKRDEIARAWLGPSPLIGGGDAGQPELAQASSPLLATKDTPFVNSLGMKFVPAPIPGGPTSGQRVLFGVWDTRVQDYEIFAKETKREWPKANFSQGPTHPAVNVSWEDAQLFCQWLTAREQAAGRLPAEWRYRLPSDHEWSCAVGIGEREDAAKLPFENARKSNDAFPWGAQWPPPKGAGNYGGEELRRAMEDRKLRSGDYVIAGYDDGFVNTSPVGSFAANRFGLFDLGGNACQWCEDWYDNEKKFRVLRGNSWRSNARGYLLSSVRNLNIPAYRGNDSGFRCVLASTSSPRLTPAIPVPAVSGAPTTATGKAPFVNAIDQYLAAHPPETTTTIVNAPFENTLGMKFAPVPIIGGPTGGQRVLFSVWDTRVQDYEAFVKETKREWPKPAFPQGPTHPAVNVSWEDAQFFCRWLTDRDHAAGRLPAEWRYRLPSDHEWSCAVGIGEQEDAAKLPVEKNDKIDGAFSWGTQWPPPKGAGNYAPTLSVDEFQYTSPVGSFPANRFGLVDIGGNVWQWCEDWYDKEQKHRVLRGASWNAGDRGTLLPSSRHHYGPGVRLSIIGFRCVVDVSAR